MKRYTWECDEDGHWYYTIAKGTPLLDRPPYVTVLASDVAELERRYREAVELLKVAQHALYVADVIGTLPRDIKAFLAGEDA